MLCGGLANRLQTISSAAVSSLKLFLRLPLRSHRYIAGYCLLHGACSPGLTPGSRLRHGGITISTARGVWCLTAIADLTLQRTRISTAVRYIILHL